MTSRSMGLKIMNNEDLKKRLRDMGTLSDSRTPQDALKYIEELEASNREYALETLSALSQAQEAYEAQVSLADELDRACQWVDYWAELWERSSTLLMQYHPALTEATEVTTEGKLWVIKELLGKDLLDKVTLEEDTNDETTGIPK